MRQTCEPVSLQAWGQGLLTTGWGGFLKRKKKVTGRGREEGKQGQEGDDLICFQPWR